MFPKRFFSLSSLSGAALGGPCWLVVGSFGPQNGSNNLTKTCPKTSPISGSVFGPAFGWLTPIQRNARRRLSLFTGKAARGSLARAVQYTKHRKMVIWGLTRTGPEGRRFFCNGLLRALGDLFGAFLALLRLSGEACWLERIVQNNMKRT